MMKVCTKCKVEKDESLFGKNRIKRNGLAGECRDCKKKADSKYRADNKDKINERGAKYRANNKDKIKIAKKEYRELNKDSISIKSKEYRQANRASIRISERKREEYYRKVLGDKYIKSLLVNKTSISKTSIPKSLIEAKRMQMMINRKLKEMTK